jgi:hypothetical protein
MKEQAEQGAWSPRGLAALKRGLRELRASQPDQVKKIERVRVKYGFGTTGEAVAFMRGVGVGRGLGK